MQDSLDSIKYEAHNCDHARRKPRCLLFDHSFLSFGQGCVPLLPLLHLAQDDPSATTTTTTTILLSILITTIPPLACTIPYYPRQKGFGRFQTHGRPHGTRPHDVCRGAHRGRTVPGRDGPIHVRRRTTLGNIRCTRYGMAGLSKISTLCATDTVGATPRRLDVGIRERPGVEDGNTRLHVHWTTKIILVTGSTNTQSLLVHYCGRLQSGTR